MLFYEDIPSCTHITPGAAYRCEIVNQQAEDMHGICAVMQDGKLIPAWNGSCFLTYSMRADELCCKLPFSMQIAPDSYSVIGSGDFALLTDTDARSRCSSGTVLYHLDSEQEDNS